MRRTITNDDGSRESESDGSIRRRPLLGTIGAFGVTAGLAGRVGADDESEWPEPGDEYYQLLVEDLSAMGLPPAEFVFGNSESATADQFWAGTEGFGSADPLTVTGDGVPFSDATRFEITEEPDENWDVQLRTADWASDPYRSVEAGDVMLGVAYLRAPDGDATAQYVASNDQSDAWNSVVSDDHQEPPAQWQRYFFPIEFDAAAEGSDFEWTIEVHLGFDVQTVDVGGLALFDFGQDIDVSELPSGAIGDDYDGGDEDEARKSSTTSGLTQMTNTTPDWSMNSRNSRSPLDTSSMQKTKPRRSVPTISPGQMKNSANANLSQ